MYDIKMQVKQASHVHMFSDSVNSAVCVAQQKQKFETYYFLQL